MRKSKGNGRPLNPRLGQLWFEPASRSMRKWDGKKWAEINRKQLAEAVRNICEEDTHENQQ